MSDDLPMFDFDAFRATFAPHWVHDRDSNRLAWHVQNRGDGIFWVEVSPPCQEMFGGPKDGEVHDVPFEFFLKDFLENPDLDIEEHGAISMNPSIFVKGTFKVSAHHRHPLAAVVGVGRAGEKRRQGRPTDGCRGAWPASPT